MPLLAEIALPLLRLLEPETAHGLTLWALRNGLAGRAAAADDPILGTGIFGRRIANPVGLAAGFDKNAEVADAMLALGFGFVEVGTITPKPQTGNPKPRLFRLAEDRAVINRLGFNNQGMEAAGARLAARRPERSEAARTGQPGLVGINLGANRDSADRAGDYVLGLKRLAPFAGYVVVNVSSPNTPGLRALQGQAELDALLERLLAARAGIGSQVPVALKIAPDLAPADCEAIAQVALAHRLDALIVSNTTIAHREGLRSPRRSETGGLSGRPLFAPSTALLKDMFRLTGGRVPLIGVGGIDSGEAAYAKIRAGASAVQLYTALIYQGPGLVARIKRDLADALRRDGFGSVAAAVGIDAR